MTWLLVAAAPFLGAYVLVARRTGGFATPDSLFIAFNTVGLLGTVVVVDDSVAVDRKYAWIVWAGLVTFTVVATAYRHLRLKGRAALPMGVAVTPLSRWLLGLYLASLLVSIAYYLALGHVVLLEALWAEATGKAYDTQTARLESYASGKYAFPGYANQFKNAILPITTVAIIHHLCVRRVRGWLPLSGAMLLVGFVLVAGTGQRGAFVIIAIVIALTAVRARLFSGVRMIGAGIAALAGFVLLTALLQRQTSQLDAADNVFEKAGVYVTAVWDRAVLVNPFSGLAAFHYTEQRPHPWGQEWLLDISGVLPGRGGSRLANEVFESLYKTDRGTAPASVWGGIYYNFGPILGLLVVVVLALALTWLTGAVFTRRHTASVPLDSLTALALSGMAVSLGSWVAGGPLTIMNQGFFAYLFVYLLATRGWPRARKQTTEALGHPVTTDTPTQSATA